MTGTLRVLAIGSKDALDLVRNALRFRRRSHLLVASNYRELCSLSIGEAVQVSVAVIEVSNSDRDLLRTAVHIRRRWPDAQILLMGREPEVLEDPLYDERIPRGIEAAELLPAVERLVKRKQRSAPGSMIPILMIQSGFESPVNHVVVDGRQNFRLGVTV